LLILLSSHTFVCSSSFLSILLSAPLHFFPYFCLLLFFFSILLSAPILFIPWSCPYTFL
jgi:hypothetical protein